MISEFEYCPYCGYCGSGKMDFYHSKIYQSRYESLFPVEQLHLFYESNQSEITKNDYENLIRWLEKQLSKESESIARAYHPSVVKSGWIESPFYLLYYIEASQWKYHDESEDTEYLICFCRYNGPTDNVDWQSKQGWPTAEIAIQTEDMKTENDDYLFKQHNLSEALMREPFGLHGIWKMIEYYDYSNR